MSDDQQNTNNSPDHTGPEIDGAQVYQAIEKARSKRRGRGRPRKDGTPAQNRTPDGRVLPKGARYVELPPEDPDDSKIVSVDVSDQKTMEMARGYFIGKHAVGRKKDIRTLLEKRVVDKIGKEGKFIVGKLFELIDGIYMADKIKVVQGKEEVTCYKVPPNLNAIIYALDRVLGKPKQLSVQANFSLSQLLVKTQDNKFIGNGKQVEQLGFGDNPELAE